jgi:hypothetical protein
MSHHEHCDHVVEVAHIVLRDGHVLVECCICHRRKQVHKDHVPPWKGGPPRPEHTENHSWTGGCQKLKARLHEAAW